MKTVSCGAPYGVGGLGQHLGQVVGEARQSNNLSQYYASAASPGDDAGEQISLPLFPLLTQYTPLRFSAGWKSFLGGDMFDRKVAARLKPAFDTQQSFVGFSGQCLHSFVAARGLGYTALELESPTSHVHNIVRQHEKAMRQWPGIETESWLNSALVHKSLREYEMADVIVVASEYSYRSFLAEGISPAKLRLRSLHVSKRFQPASKRPEDGVFRIVYTGSLTVSKGLPVLLKAFSCLKMPQSELTLVGGWATRGMRCYLQKRLADDSRIRIAPGDPLPYLQRADVYVHPTYQDGFAYAPMEALACGVPVIVTEDTGMKEHVREGVNGYVVPTGSWKAILTALIILNLEKAAV